MICSSTTDDASTRNDHDAIKKHPLKVLVVDDDRDIVESMTIILTKAGCEVLAAYSCESCLSTLEYFDPAIIIMDLMLETVSDGLRLCRELRNNPAYSTIPIIIVSSIEQHTGFNIIDTEHLADSFIAKTFEPTFFLNEVLRIACEHERKTPGMPE